MSPFYRWDRTGQDVLRLQAQPEGDPQGTVLRHQKRRQRKPSPESKPPPPERLTPGTALGSSVVTSRFPNPIDFTYTVSD